MESVSRVSTVKRGKAVAGKDQLAERYEQHAPSGMRLAFVLTGDQHLAEDLVHDAFAKVARRSLKLREPEAFGAYFHRAIINLHTSRLRRLRHERSYLAAQASAGGHPAMLQPDTAEREDLWSALLTLPARQRAALYFRFYEDRSEIDTAAALGCTPGAAKQLVLRATTTLRNQLGGEEA